MLRRYRLALFLLTTTLVPPAGAVLHESEVPEPLRPWIDWVLYGHEEIACPFLFNDAGQRRCAWPSRLELDFNNDGGQFNSEWEVYAPSWIQLPGNSRYWPQEVTVDGQPAVVLQRGERPSIYLQPGRYRLHGGFSWEKLPESFPVPEGSGLIDLRVNGVAQVLPRMERNGQLWLAQRKREGPEAEQDALNLQVFRHIDDDIPAVVTTRVQIEVSGDQREILVGPVLFGDFVPMSLSSQLPARLEPDGRLRIQVRPGSWVVEFAARSTGPLDRLAAPRGEPPWPEEEVWVFQARTELRLAELEGLTPIDPRQTSLPVNWQQLPAYRWGPGNELTFKTIRRGDPLPEPDQLNLDRQIWLDFDGSGYSISDHISGSMTQGWRLNAGADLELGRAVLNGEPQFITLDDNDRRGVEVRRGSVDLAADSRYQGPVSMLSAVGWDHDFHSLSATLHLPPGWTLLSASGIDSVADTWFKRWTLLDLFLVLIIVLAIGRLWGWRWGALAFAALVLSWHQPDAPRQVWLHLLAALALLRVLPAGKLKRLVGLYRNLTLIALVVIVVPFLIDQVRVGLFPQLERPWQTQVRQEWLGDVVEPAPSAPAARAEAPLLEELTVTAQLSKQAAEDEMRRKALAAESAISSEGGVAGGLSSKPQLQMIDPQATIQTGPGVPTWRWNEIPLSWNGPVERDQQMRFTLLSPGVNLLLSIMRVVLITVFSAFFLAIASARIKLPGVGTLMVAICLPSLFAAEPVRAQTFPDPVMLEELKQRLLEPAECQPRCAEIPRLVVRAHGQRIELELEVLVAEASAVPLPVDPDQWLPEEIWTGTAVARALERRQGSLWLQLEAGRHEIKLSGATPPGQRIRLPLALRPARVDTDLSGWQVEGVREDGRPDAQLVLIRTDQSAIAEAVILEPTALPAFAVVERTLRLGLEWRVETRVVRRSPAGAGVVLAVPLLDGESVTTPGINVVDGRVQVNLTPGQRELNWASVLNKTDNLTLAAPDSDDWTEVWRVDVGPIWHVQTIGIAVVHHQDRSGQWLPEWRPWPGEQVKLAITRPTGVEGRTLTIESTQLSVEPGRRATDVTLDIDLRSSQGGQHNVVLPEGAQLLAVTIDGAAQPIRQDGREVNLPVHPGSQQIRLQWRSPDGIVARFTSPQVDLGATSVNSRIQISQSRDRWSLLVGGPSLGPAVLFWGVLVVVAIIAVGLARSALTPLGTGAWLLLGIGLSQVNIWLALIVVAWLLALGLRSRRGAALGKTAFNLSQLGLAFLTVAALVVLFHAVKQGLLGLPEMQIAGNGSTAYVLNWYQDLSTEQLPTAWVISVPVLAYRLLMLAWALWLAFALLRWLRWGWQAYSESGLWRSFSLNVRRKDDHKPVTETE
jgi:hypothetical protein